MFLVSSISAVSASDTGKIGTYLRIDSPTTVHQGDKIDITVECYGIQSGWFDTDEWIRGAAIILSVYDGKGFGWGEAQVTNAFGNAGFTLNTKNMEPGMYTIEAHTKNADQPYNERYAESEKKTVIEVLPKK